MIFVDSGYLIGLLDPRDQLHAKAAAWARAAPQSLLTTEFVLCEAVNRFSMPVDRNKIHRALDKIYAADHWEVVPVSRGLLVNGLALHRQHTDKEWSLTDCISFRVIRDRSVTQALTYDHHFEQAGFEALLRRRNCPIVTLPRGFTTMRATIDVTGSRIDPATLPPELRAKLNTEPPARKNGTRLSSDRRKTTEPPPRKNSRKRQGSPSRLPWPRCAVRKHCRPLRGKR